MKLINKIALTIGGIGLTAFAACAAYRYWHLNCYPRDHQISLSEFTGNPDISKGE